VARAGREIRRRVCVPVKILVKPLFCTGAHSGAVALLSKTGKQVSTVNPAGVKKEGARIP
jgi:hypothetical protein